MKSALSSMTLIKHSLPKTGVALIELNRPKALNALCDSLFMELNEAMRICDKDAEVGAIVLTGNEKAFAAGADIKEMKDKTYAEALSTDMLAFWSEMSRIRKPIIAAVNGFALGGGFELALLCDIIYAGSNAKFGFPEVTIGTIPGGGGTQRLIREIGKSKAMELILTGQFISAEEALKWGIAAGVCAPEETVNQAIKTAEKISSLSRPVSKLSALLDRRGFLVIEENEQLPRQRKLSTKLMRPI